MSTSTKSDSVIMSITKVQIEQSRFKVIGKALDIVQKKLAATTPKDIVLIHSNVDMATGRLNLTFKHRNNA